MKKKWIAIIAILAIVCVFAAACSNIDSSLLDKISAAVESSASEADQSASQSETPSDTTPSDGSEATLPSENGETETPPSGENGEMPTPPSGENGEMPTPPNGNPGSNSGNGGQIPGGTQSGTVTVSESSITSEDYALTLAAPSSAEYNADEAISIDLSSLTEESAPAGTTFKDGVLTVNQAGVYVLTGELNGAVEVAKNVEGKVQIVLAGATIKTLDSQTSAAIVFNKTDSERILTLAAGTENLVSDSVGDDAENGDGAAIQAKKCSLTINGTGSLTVVAVGEEANGIKVKNELTIADATLSVQAVKNGIKADNLVYLSGATVTVNAGNDGVKTDIEPETEEEAAAYALDRSAGVIYIENSSLTITAGDDGVSANSLLYIANEEDDVIRITTNGGAPQTVTSKSSDNASGKALKASGIVLEDEEGNETLFEASYEENYAIVITGGTFYINSNDDAIHSKGNLLIEGGNVEIESGDDGLHAEYLTKVTGGTVTVAKSYEGIEGGAVEITGGTVSVLAADDGVNAANADLDQYDYHILVSGGELTVNAEGDGLDSNRTLLISGGNVTVLGPSAGGNSALDSEKGTSVTGGTVITLCKESMDPVSVSGYVVSANVNIQKGATVTLKDSSGNVVVSFVSEKAASNLMIYSPSLASGNYTLTVGDSSVTVSATTGNTGRPAGGMGGGFAPGGNFSGRGQAPSGGFAGGPRGRMISENGENAYAGDGGEIPSFPEEGQAGTNGENAFNGRGQTPPQGGAFGEEGAFGGRQGNFPPDNGAENGSRGAFPPFGEGGGMIPNGNASDASNE